MKRGKKFLILLAVLAVLAGGAAAAPLLTPDTRQPEETQPAVTAFALDPEQLTQISWTVEEETLTFGFKDGAWYNVLDAAFPTDGTLLEEMKAALTEITAEKTIETPEALENYGLLRPVCTVNVTAGDVTGQLLIGDKSAVDGLRYMATGDGKVYMVNNTLYDCFQYGLYDLVMPENIPVMERVTSLNVTAGEQNLTLEYLENSGLAYSSYYKWFAREGDALRAMDVELAETFLAGVTGLTWDACVAHNADEAALETYGLAEPAVTVTLRYGQTEDVPEQQFSVEMGLTEDAAYARLPGSRMVYEIDRTLAESLCYTTSEELQPDEVLRMDWEAVETVAVELEGESYVFVRQMKDVTDSEGNVTGEAVYLLEEEELPLQEILDDVEAMASVGYANGMEPQRNPELQLVFTTANEAFPEIRLTFCRYDSNSCLVQLNGESTVYVSREAVVELKEAVTELVLD